MTMPQQKYCLVLTPYVQLILQTIITSSLTWTCSLFKITVNAYLAIYHEIIFHNQLILIKSFVYSKA